MNLLVTLDSNYVHQLLVMLKSISHSNPCEKLTVYIIHTRLTEFDLALIKSSFPKYSFISIVPDDEIFDGAHFTKRITKETYYTAVFDSSKVTGIQNVRLANLNVSVNVVSRNIQISAAPVGSGYAIFDMQGRVLKKGRVESPNFNIMMPRAGTYFVKVGSLVQRINIK